VPPKSIKKGLPNLMNGKYIFIWLILLICSNVYGQETDMVLEGIVTFLTSNNVYVKFENTEMLKIGDTLKTKNNQPCLLVSSKSSRSVVCSRINDCLLEKNTIVIYKYSSVEETFVESEAVVEDIGISYNDSIKSIQQKPKSSFYDEKINGRLSASSYSTFSDTRDDRHRLMSRVSLNAEHFNYSKFSFETYINYRYTIASGSSNASRNDKFLRIFNLALKYDIDSTLSVTLGRKINYKLSSLGAIDGLQTEKLLGNYYVGAIAGFRPDIFDFGFNPDLLQYGAYVGRYTNSKNFVSQTTVGAAEQRNKKELDRRFVYFQHSSAINKKLNLFSLAELDIYNISTDSVNSSPRLTNLYVSARYRFNRNINVSLSYDSRKRIIYYKTYETEIEELLDEDIARQGIRARINFRPVNKLYSGFSYSRRFQSDNQNKSENYYGYVSYSKLPQIDGSLSITYNINSSNYLESNIASIRYSRGFFEDRLNADFYYRFVNYKYTSNIPEFSQHYIGTYLSYYIDRSLIVSLTGEYSTYDLEKNYRLNFRIIKRLYLKRKK
jgi:hypothetical protein